MKKQYDVAAYVWPAYGGADPRTRLYWPKGIGEWESVLSAEKKRPDHEWPRKPLWGYVNEADPAVMEMEIEQATKYGVNVFIFDWYWYEGKPFIENMLRDGFLKAKNNQKMKFYIMYANHDTNYVWNKSMSHLIYEIPYPDTIIWTCDVSWSDWEKICDRFIEYFKMPNYYQIKGKPVLNIMDLFTFSRTFGNNIEKGKEALRYLQEKTKQAGFKDGFHLQTIQQGYGNKDISGMGLYCGSLDEFLKRYEVDSTTCYQFAGMVNVSRRYEDLLPDVQAYYDQMQKEGRNFYPQVSMGWDNNPRYVSSIWREAVTTDCKPEYIEKALRMAKDYVDKYRDVPLITINSWNEWTESSYLQPDDLHGYGYLEAVKKVFVDED